VQFTSAGATAADNQATAVTFTMRYDRAGAAGPGTADGVLGGTRAEIGTSFVYSYHRQVLSLLIQQLKLYAIKLVKRYFRTNHVKSMRVYDGTQGAEIQESLHCYITRYTCRHLQRCGCNISRCSRNNR
jgi:hypothetical protein